MPILESIIGGLNPYIEKNRFKYILKEYNKESYHIESNECSIIEDIFIQNHKIKNIEENIREEIFEISELSDNWNGLGTKKISAEVINNTINIVNAIPPSVLCYLNRDNIYPSKFGTIIMDWEFGNKDNIFSLEIARNSVGYFIELNGEDHLQVESLNIGGEDFDNAISSINHDLLILL